MRKIYLIGFLFAIISCETKQTETNVIQKNDSVSQSEDSVSQTMVDVHLPVCTLIPENNYGKGLDASRPMGAIKRYFWPEAKKILNVQFLDGSPDIRQKIIEYAKEWENYCGIQFNFSTNEAADITITCNTKGYWSYIGTQSKLKQPSMGFDLVNKTVSDEELRQYVLHEFGHALGLIP
jgi:serralysin